MRHRRNHDVPARVRIQVQDDERQLAAFDDQVFLVVRTRQCIAKDAAFLLGTIFDVFHTPGGPDPFHDFEIVAEK